MASFFTRSGDEGYTSILGKGKVPKYDIRLEALGSLDEANAALGVARHHCQDPKSKELIIHIQHQLYILMGEIAATPENAARFKGISSDQVSWLEEHTNNLSQTAKFPGEFIVPGDTLAGAALDVARTIVRRSERRVLRQRRPEEQKPGQGASGAQPRSALHAGPGVRPRRRPVFSRTVAGRSHLPPSPFPSGNRDVGRRSGREAITTARCLDSSFQESLGCMEFACRNVQARQ